MVNKNDDTTNNTCAGVLLCGGKSRRMGFDKAFLQVEGHSLLGANAKGLGSYFPLVLAVTDKADKFRRDEVPKTVRVVEDHYPGAGPLGGICTAFEETDVPCLFVMACDMPRPDFGLAQRLLAKRADAQVALFTHEGKAEPLFAVYHRSCLPVFKGQLQRGEYRLRQQFSQLRVREVPLSGEEAKQAFANLNTPEELARWESEHALPEVPQMVLIGAAGRGAGKTELAGKTIGMLRESGPVVGVKVVRVERPGMPCHRGGAGCGLCGTLEGRFDLREETGEDPEKDTARMLAAGAKQAYLLRALPKAMAEGFAHFLKQVPKNALIVCESNSLRKVIRPGVFLYAAGDKTEEGRAKPSARAVRHLADRVIFRGGKPPMLNVFLGPDGVPVVGLGAK